MMKKTFAVLCYAVAAVCAAMAGVTTTSAEGFWVFVHFSSLGAFLVVSGIVFFFCGTALIIGDRRVLQSTSEIEREIRKTGIAPKNSVWEWALLINGILAGILFYVLFAGVQSGVEAYSNIVGAVLFALVLQLGVGFILVFAFMFKGEKRYLIFFPGLALFTLEAALLVVIFLFGKPVLQV